MPVPEKVIERLSLYRRLLDNDSVGDDPNIYSHTLAKRANVTAAQVRRDISELGFPGGSKKGYEVQALIRAISEFLDHPDGEPVILLGIGNLGRALLPFLANNHPNVRIVAAFDQDPMKTGRVIHGCRCYQLNDLEQVIKEQDVKVAILAVPAAMAQRTADRLTKAGVAGIMNFAPVPLEVAPGVVVENIDMTMVLEKVAYLARAGARAEEPQEN